MSSPALTVDLVAAVEGDPGWAEALDIRWEVFVVEQAVPAELERDERDAEADHVLARVDGVATGTGRLLVEPPGFAGVDPGFGPVAHVGRLAVRAGARGRGVGAALVRALQSRAGERGLRVVYLGAQVHAVPFYERLGYTAYGEVFDDAGIAHRRMWRRV
jgi:predicted GNAT family N-acyltransferase